MTDILNCHKNFKSINSKQNFILIFLLVKWFVIIYIVKNVCENVHYISKKIKKEMLFCKITYNSFTTIIFKNN